MSFQCPNCKRSLDWSADRCPSCRRDIRKDKENAKSLGRLFLLLLISPYLILMLFFGTCFKIFGRYKNQGFWQIICKDWLVHVVVIITIGMMFFILNQNKNNHLVKDKNKKNAEIAEIVESGESGESAKIVESAEVVEGAKVVEGADKTEGPSNKITPTAPVISSNELPVAQMEHNYHDKLPMSANTLSKLDAHQIEMIILYIYARHHASFESPSAQRWAEAQSWYKKIEGRTIHDAEKSFNHAAKSNVKMLIDRWNEIQKEKGLPAVAVENSPLAGRATNADFEDTRIAETKSEVELPNTKILSTELIAKWDAIRIRNEINTIYAKYGVEFTNAELRSWAENLPEYKPVSGRTFADAEALFSETDRKNIKLLAARREQIKLGN